MSPVLALAEGHSIEAVALQGAAELAWLIPLLPLLAALVITFITRSRGGLSAGVSITAICGSLGISVPILLQRLQMEDGPPMEISVPWLSVGAGSVGTIHVGLLVDNLTACMLVMVCFIGLLIQIYSYSYISTEVGHFPTQGSASVSRFFGYLSLFVFSMLGLVLSNNLIQIYFFWELVGLCSYFLVGFWYFKSSAALASKKAFVVTKFADIGFLLGFVSLGLTAKTFNFLELEMPNRLDNWTGAWPLAVALALVFCGAIGKSAQFPLHIWLPDAMEGPTPVSALIHAATMVAAGVYLVARLFPLFFAVPGAGLFVAYIGAITAFIAGTIAVVQNDIKRVLAYSTVSQLGFMLAALGCGAMTAGTFHLITHAFFKALLFLGSGAVIVACHSNDMWDMGGLRKHMPVTWLTFLAGCLALAGCIPFAGFWSKDEILLGVSHQPVILGLLLVSAFLTAFYVTRMYCITFLGQYRGHDNRGPYAGPVPPAELPPPVRPSKEAFGMEPHWTEVRAAAEMVEEDEHSHSSLPAACLGALSEHVPHGEPGAMPHEVSPMMYVPLVILSFFAVGLGVLGLPNSQYFHHFVHPLQQGNDEFSPVLMLTSIIIAFSGMGLGYWMYGSDPVRGEKMLRSGLGKVRVFLQQKWYFDHLWAQLLTHTLYADANRVGEFEEKVVDRAVYKTGEATFATGDTLRQEQSGLVQKYAWLIVTAGVVLIVSVGIIEPTFMWSLFNLLHVLRGGH